MELLAMCENGILHRFPIINNNGTVIVLGYVRRNYVTLEIVTDYNEKAAA